MKEAAKVWELETWINFAKEKIMPLCNYAKRILTFWAQLREYRDRPLTDVIQEWKNAEAIFVRDTEPIISELEVRGMYLKDGFTYLCKLLFGASVDIDHYWAYKVQELEPDVKCKVEDTQVLNFVRGIYDHTTRILNTLGLQEETEIDLSQYIDRPELIVDDVFMIVEKSLSLTVLYDSLVHFAWTLRKITWKYLVELYPWIMEEYVFERIREILGVSKVFTPEIKDPKKREDYTVFGYIDYVGKNPITLGGLLCMLNDFIWFNMPVDVLRLVVEGLENPLKEYREHAERKLREIERQSVRIGSHDLEKGINRTGIKKIRGFDIGASVG